MAPLVEGNDLRKKLAAVLAYSLPLAAGAVGVGVLIAFVGNVAWGNLATAEASAPWLALLGVTALAYAVGEHGFRRLPVLSSHWEVPRSWTRGSNLRSMALFGAAVGPGILTRSLYPAFGFMILWSAVLGVPAFGAVLGLLYAAGRSTGVIAAGFKKTGDAVADVPHGVSLLAAESHYLNAAVLILFASYVFGIAFFGLTS